MNAHLWRTGSGKPALFPLALMVMALLSYRIAGRIGAPQALQPVVVPIERQPTIAFGSRAAVPDLSRAAARTLPSVVTVVSERVFSRVDLWRQLWEPPTKKGEC